MAKRTYFNGEVGGVPAHGWLTQSDDEEEMRLDEIRKEKSTCGPVCKTVKAAAVVGAGALLIGMLASKKT
jgi:hypothetical protein